MPTFETPEPIFATIDISAGDVMIEATERSDTVVEVRPRKESSDSDVQEARLTTVEYAGGRLLVRSSKKGARSWFRWGGWVRVTVHLPADSQIDVQTSSGELVCDGRVGESRLQTHDGDIRVDRAGRLELSTANGDVTVADAAGRTDVTSANGDIRITKIGGAAAVKTANGGIFLGEVGGDLRANTASGDITIRRVLASVAAKTAYGNIRVGEAEQGAVALDTSAGNLEVGIREGTAAWLDVSSQYGNVRNLLDTSAGPVDSDKTIEVRAHTSYGDVEIHRA